MSKQHAHTATPGPAGLQASVVIATYNRPELLAALLEAFAQQTCVYTAFEVVVVDDGSRENMQPITVPFATRLQLQFVRQANGGAAAARQAGANHARAALVIFIDDDMRVPAHFVAEHIAAHAIAESTVVASADAAAARPRVVMGRLLAESAIAQMPLFERFYARMLDRMADGFAAGTEHLRGPQIYTGNLSMPRELFFRVGGFDSDFRQIEDAELGVRLELAGAEFVFSEKVATVHASDHVSAARWLQRSLVDGRHWVKLARKHPREAHANPWRYLTGVNVLSRPFLAATVAVPAIAPSLSASILAAATRADALGLDKLAVSATTLVYGIQYFRGVREETGSMVDVVREYREFRRGLASLADGTSDAAPGLRAEIAEDHAMLLETQGKYGSENLKTQTRGTASDAINNIGFQLLIGYRVMRALRASGLGLAAKFCSRLLRHLYGSDIHWDAVFEPGVVIVHGFGLAINGDVYVSRGCILFQHITLGRGLDAVTKQSGAPRLEPYVHVGVGATLVGPITVGTRSKIMPGCTLVASVPPNSVVESPAPHIRPRGVATAST
jgi:serine acetyltransferase/GT2 family glycosyltransferase